MTRQIIGAYDSQESFVQFPKPMTVIEHGNLLFQKGRTKPAAQKLGNIWFCLSNTKAGLKPTYRVEVKCSI